MSAVSFSFGLYAADSDLGTLAAAINLILILRLEGIFTNRTDYQSHFLDPLKVFHSSPNSAATHFPSR